MKLFIDTSVIRLSTVTFGSFKKTSYSLLPLIEEALLENNYTWKDITEIDVKTGPGSYTGLRIGAAVANILGYLFQIPVNGKKTLVIPEY